MLRQPACGGHTSGEAAPVRTGAHLMPIPRWIGPNNSRGIFEAATVPPERLLACNHVWLGCTNALYAKRARALDLSHSAQRHALYAKAFRPIHPSSREKTSLPSVSRDVELTNPDTLESFSNTCGHGPYVSPFTEGMDATRSTR